jgi:hypothetical protein
MTRDELLAWARHPETLARAAEIEEWEYQERLRKWREAEQGQLRITREAADRERRQREEAARKREADKRADAERQRRLSIQRRRERHAQHYGLQIRDVRVEQRGDHTIWSTGHRTKRMVHGIASTPTVTTNNHSRSSAGCVVDFPIPLLCKHEALGSIGEIVMLRRSPREIYVIAALHDNNLAADHAWSLVEQGELRALSVASVPSTSKIDGAVLGTKFYGSWQLAEVSLCRVGANPDCNDVQVFSNRRRIL